MENNPLVPIAVLVFVLSFALALGLFFWRLIQREKLRAIAAQEKRKEIEERQRRAYFAQARILRANNSQTIGRESVKVDLLLEVMPPNSASYQVSATWLVDLSSLSQVQQGQMIQIKIDSKDSQQIYPGAEWAQVWLWG